MTHKTHWAGYKRCNFFTMPSVRTAEMSLPALLLGLVPLLLSLTASSPAPRCPSSCSCNFQTSVIFCVSADLSEPPSDIPVGTLHLYLFENSISQLSDSSFVGLPRLHTLDLSYNRIRLMPPALFDPLTDLKNIDLSGNLIGGVTNETFRGLATLERLYLQNNRISGLQPGCFDSLENLLEIKLQGNLLKTFYPIQAPNLLLLELSRNPLVRLEPHTFRSVNVEILSLSGIGLTELRDDVFDNVSNMRDLDLSDNQLTSVPTVLQKMSSLGRLNISKNFELSPTVRDDFRPLPRLQVLDVSHCGARHFPQRFLRLFPGLSEITAAGNPFHCNCQMSWLLHWLRSAGATVVNARETRCHFPPRNAGKQLDGVQYADLGCPKTTVVATTYAASTTTTATTTTTAAAATTTTAAATTVSAAASTTTPTRAPPVLAAAAATEQALPPELGPGDVAGPPSPSESAGSPCDGVRCQHGGVCAAEPGAGPLCLCGRAWLGARCEVAKEAPAAPPESDLVSAVFSTAVDVRLRASPARDPDLRGFQLTYYEASSGDRRPTTLNLPPSYSAYTLRGLRPNSTYVLCLRPVGRGGAREQRCARAHTRPGAQAQNLTRHSPSPEGRHASALLASVVSGLVLLLVALIALVCYRKQRSKRRAAEAGYDAVKYDHGGGNAAGTASEALRPHAEDEKFAGQKAAQPPPPQQPPVGYGPQGVRAQHSLQAKEQSFRPPVGRSSLL